MILYTKEFPMALIPEEVKKKVKFKRYSKMDFIYEQGEDKIIYIIKGQALKVRIDEDGEKTFPYIFSNDEFAGVNAYFAGGSDWEVVALSREVEGIEIPTSIFEEYILTTPLFIKKYIPKCTKLLYQGLRGFYIYTQGGTVAYFAYLLCIMSKDKNIIQFDSYTDLTRLIYTNKSSLYRITNQLTEEGLIEKNKNTITIQDRKGLEKYFESYKY